MNFVSRVFLVLNQIASLTTVSDNKPAANTSNTALIISSSLRRTVDLKELYVLVSNFGPFESNTAPHAQNLVISKGLYGTGTELSSRVG